MFQKLSTELTLFGLLKLFYSGEIAKPHDNASTIGFIGSDGISMQLLVTSVLIPLVGLLKPLDC